MLSKESFGRFDYSKLVIGEIVEVDLFGRDIHTARRAIWTHAKRKFWKVRTKTSNGKLYAMRVK